ncbi:MAG: hypothetical protein Q4E37_00640 [Tissierellia bacterium]|nr:hypothetical protein [Tissierellia bacterium]
MGLLEKIYPEFNVCSIIGMSKNSGKTFTLNHLIEEADMAGLSMGITSIGRDGERIDVVTETDKPTIFLPKDNWVATTTELLDLSEATVAIEKVTPFTTPLGGVVVGRVIYDGYIQISGPQTLHDTRQVAEDMLELGSDVVLIDGALDRKTTAAPEITEATILAAGASYNRDMETVVRETAHIARLFKLPLLEDHRDLVAELVRDKTHALIDKDGQVRTLEMKTALGAGRRISEAISQDTEYVLIPGALTLNLAKDLVDLAPGIGRVKIIVADTTKVFIDDRNYRRLVKRGLYIEALHRSKLVAIAINPFAPEGYSFDAYEFREQMKEAIPDVDVVDLMLGG